MTKPLTKIDLPFKRTVITSLATNLLFILLVVLLKNNLPPQVPLLYGLPEGEEQLVPRLLLILPNTLAIGITLINIGLTFVTKDLFMRKLLLVVPVVVTFLAVITTLKILFLVGSF